VGTIGKSLRWKTKGPASYYLLEVYTMGTRLELKTLLETLLGSNKVYFQPPPGYMMSYPCIVYQRSNIRSKSADNAPYNLTKEYTVTVIDADPDSAIPDKVSKLPRAIFDRHFVSDNLNHDVFNILF